MARADEGLRSADLKRALDEALAGEAARLEKLLSMYGGLPGPRPNLGVAEAVGVAAGHDPRGAALLAQLSGNDAAPDTAEVFLPVVGAFGWVARLRALLAAGTAAPRSDRGRALDAAWDALRELAADERRPVRSGTAAALAPLARTAEGSAALVARGLAWLDDDVRERRWSALTTLLDVLGERPALDALVAREAFLELLSRLLADVADAPRAAERSDGRRRVLVALGHVAALVAAAFRGQPDGAAWLEAELARARHPDLRRAFEATLDRLRRRGGAQKVETLVALDEALASSAKPPRDPDRIREHLRGRGKKRRTRGA